MKSEGYSSQTRTYWRPNSMSCSAWE